ncbi:MAG: 16S rRNA (uracil(1498)-N(3))-methyltransferase [Gammaproteobacteria bacterium]
MRGIRVFAELPLEKGREFVAPEALAHYMRDVLRLRSGDPIRTFNGSGEEFAGVVGAVSRKAMRILVGEELPALPESPLAVHLGLGLSKGERMDYALQKATELGVASITPLLLARCNAKLPEERSESRMRHWRRVIVGACEQSGRARLPELGLTITLEGWLGTRPELPGLVLHTRDALTLDAFGEAPSGVRVLVGPEGGLEDAEFAAALAAGFRAWSLGPRVLRAETAPVAALAVLQHRWGDL